MSLYRGYNSGENAPLKLLLVGDRHIGKTSFLLKYHHGKPPEGYTPIVAGPYEEIVSLSEDLSSSSTGNITTVPIIISEMPPPDCDTGDRLLPLCYIDASIVLICFGIDEPESLSSVIDKWGPEVLHHMARKTGPGHISFFLVGLKKDLRQEGVTEASKRTISFDEGIKTSRAIGATKYMECSSVTGEGMSEIVQVATRLAYTVKKKRSSGCIVV